MTGAEALVKRNLRSLVGVLPDAVLSALERCAPCDWLEVVETRGGDPSARVDGRFLYSRYDPPAEAARLVRREVDHAASVCLFYHFGLGYHPEALLASRPRAVAIVIEPDESAFAAALRSRDLTKLLASERLRLLVGVPPEELPQLFDSFPGARFATLRLRSLDARDRSYFERVDEVVSGYLARRDVNRNTLARFGKLWTRNLLTNVPLLARADGLEALRGRFTGFPAVVLAAGPSLDRVLGLLPALALRAIVIAVDTSLRAALRARTRPDFCVVVDPQYWNTRHLDGCYGALASTVLVSESSTHPAVFRNHRGPVRLCASLFPLGEYLERELPPKGKLGAGGSVATTAWDFARLLGCAPIYVAGLDLGFPDRRTHFKGAYFEERAHTLSRRLSPAETHAYHALVDALPFAAESASGGHALTDQRLVIYRWWFENQLALHPDALTRSLAPDGIKISGMEVATLEELLELPVRRAEIEHALAPIVVPERSEVTVNREPLERALERLRGELLEIERAAHRGVVLNERLTDALRSGRETATIVDELDRIDSTIVGSETREVAGFLAHAAADEVLRDGAHDDATTRAERLYRAIAESARYHIELASRTLGRLSEQTS